MSQQMIQEASHWYIMMHASMVVRLRLCSSGLMRIDELV